MLSYWENPFLEEFSGAEFSRAMSDPLEVKGSWEDYLEHVASSVIKARWALAVLMLMEALVAPCHCVLHHLLAGC